MKVSFNIECTPEEARRFMGLPEMQVMQDNMVKQLEQNMTAAISAMDPQGFLRAFMPMQNFEQMQKMFWGQMQQNLANFAGMTGAMCLPPRKTGN